MIKDLSLDTIKILIKPYVHNWKVYIKIFNSRTNKYIIDKPDFYKSFKNFVPLTVYMTRNNNIEGVSMPYNYFLARREMSENDKLVDNKYNCVLFCGLFNDFSNISEDAVSCNYYYKYYDFIFLKGHYNHDKKIFFTDNNLIKTTDKYIKQFLYIPVSTPKHIKYQKYMTFTDMHYINTEIPPGQ